MKRLGKRIGWGLLLVVGGLLLYGVFIEPRLLLEVEREEAHVPALPAAWEGQQVAVLGDFQVGLFLDNAGLPTYAVLGNHDYGVATAEDAIDLGVAPTDGWSGPGYGAPGHRLYVTRGWA